MLRFAILLLVIGGILLLAGFKAVRLASIARPAPHPITCADLADHGPGDNAHVEMSDFFLAYLTYVKVQPAGAAEWSAVYVPAVPLQSEYHRKVLEQIDPHTNAAVGQPPVPGSFGVIVRGTRAHSEDDLKAMAGRDTIEGVVVNAFDPLPPEVADTLRKTFPGVDFDKVWVLDEGRTPPTATKGYVMLGVGATLALIALGLAATGALARGSADQQRSPGASDEPTSKA
jgi:hypothetical protein